MSGSISTAGIKPATQQVMSSASGQSAAFDAAKTSAETAPKAGAGRGKPPAIKVGEQIPSLVIKQPIGGDIDTAALFGRKKVVLFGVPGAFTPTCSGKHLPAYVQQASAFRDKGVDKIVCLTPDNAFVTKAWGEAQDVKDSVTIIGDGNGELISAIGMGLDLSHRGMGERSQRYAAVVVNSTVTHLAVEASPSDVSVSSAEHTLQHLSD